MKKSHIFILILVAAGARLAPMLWTGMPFSTDGWPLISNVETILSESPISLASTAFDGYCNYWPASQVFGGLLSEVTSLSAIDAMAFGIPAASSISALILYAISEEITENQDTAFVSALIFSLAFPLVLFTAGVTKETFATPLYLLLILLFLRWEDDYRVIPLFLLTSVALVTAHHFTTLMAVAILGLAAGSYLIGDFRWGTSSSKLYLLPPILLASLFGVYYFFFAKAAAFSLPDLPHWISAGGYQALGFSLVAYSSFSESGESRSKKILAIGVSLLILAILLVGTRIPLISGAPKLPVHYIIYSIPFLLAAPLVVLGRKELGRKSRTFVYAWLTTVIAVIAFATFGGAEESLYSLVLGFRSINFLIPPLSILMASGIVYLWKPDAGLSSAAGTLGLVAIILGSVFSYYGAVVREERYMGYQFVQTEGEFEASEWVSGREVETVAADTKAMYMLGIYQGIDVDIRAGYSYLIGRGSQPQMLYVYDQMYRTGYIIGLYPLDLPREWTERLEKMDLIYTNEFAEIYGESENDRA